ncbi:hypothetical protein GCM10011583_68740 [Streptomyces camponoticapitis]|uniref:Uncharacterized protein n=1 Tax=Streptomyces camponoticapitis TaxID=1616125 RepID=A0ABQ2EXT9_9ACTN|nr:hypothetical protein GCM10011583_68740 [Streptomyces camponoticapitis]
MPSGWADAVALWGSSLSQGKTGSREETADTVLTLSVVLSCRYDKGNTSVPYGESPYGTEGTLVSRSEAAAAVRR